MWHALRHTNGRCVAVCSHWTRNVLRPCAICMVGTVPHWTLTQRTTSKSACSPWMRHVLRQWAKNGGHVIAWMSPRLAHSPCSSPESQPWPEGSIRSVCVCPCHGCRTCLREPQNMMIAQSLFLYRLPHSSMKKDAPFCCNKGCISECFFRPLFQQHLGTWAPEANKRANKREHRSLLFQQDFDPQFMEPNVGVRLVHGCVSYTEQYGIGALLVIQFLRSLCAALLFRIH